MIAEEKYMPLPEYLVRDILIEAGEVDLLHISHVQHVSEQAGLLLLK